jgi:sugar phosphate isomerase/epimerase
VVHLAYCGNVHPAETVDGICAQLYAAIPALRARLEVHRVGIGLWIPAGAVEELQFSATARRELRRAVRRSGAEVVTLNGVPYSSSPVVKHAAFRPDWHERERLFYTLELARLLTELLPDDVGHGTISTLPLGWHDRWSSEETTEVLDRLAEGLDGIAATAGRTVRVGLEPEPGCTIETTEQAVEVLSTIRSDLVGVCLDTCHLAVQFEEPEQAVDRLVTAGVPIVKAQLASALRAPAPARAHADRLIDLVEPRSLHQTRERMGEVGGVTGVDDLPDALDGGLPGDGEWRMNFHVPVRHAAEETTQEELVRAMGALVGTDTPATRHLEVETYHWSVLPQEGAHTDEHSLADGIAAELAWTRDRLLDLGLDHLSR